MTKTWKYHGSVQFSSVQSLSHVRLFATSWTAARHCLPVHHQLPEFTQTHIHWVGDAIQPSHPLSSPSPPALSVSQHQCLFQWVSSFHQVVKVLEFQLQKSSPSNEHPGLISFRMDWLEKPNLTERASLKCTVVSVKCSKLYLDTFNWGLCDNAAALPGRWEASRLQCNPSGLATRRCSSSAQRSPCSDLQMTPCLWQKAKKN